MRAAVAQELPRPARLSCADPCATSRSARSNAAALCQGTRPDGEAMTSLGPSVLRSAADRRWPVDEWRYQRRLRIGLLVGWVLVMGAAAAFGPHPGNLQELRADVASGQVRTVVVGEELPLGGRRQHLSWQRGWFRYELPVSSRDIAEDLQRKNSELRVVHTV